MFGGGGGFGGMPIPYGMMSEWEEEAEVVVVETG